MSNFIDIRKKKIEERKKRAELLKPKIVEVLVNNFGVKRIYLFGSLGDGDFDLTSDIDVACEGIPDRAFLRAGCLLEKVCEGFEVDLVEINDAPPLLKKRILEKGELLYERK